MKLRSEVLKMIADLINAVGRQRMLDRPQVGDIVLFSGQWIVRPFIEAEITGVAEKETDLGFVDWRYQVRPVCGFLRYRRWVRGIDIEGIVSRAADRQRQQEIEKLEKML